MNSYDLAGPYSGGGDFVTRAVQLYDNRAGGALGHYYRLDTSAGVFLMFDQWSGAELDYYVELSYLMHGAHGQDGFTPDPNLGYVYSTGSTSGCTVPDTDPSCRSDLTKVE